MWLDDGEMLQQTVWCQENGPKVFDRPTCFSTNSNMLQRLINNNHDTKMQTTNTTNVYCSIATCRPMEKKEQLLPPDSAKQGRSDRGVYRYIYNTLPKLGHVNFFMG